MSGVPKLPAGSSRPREGWQLFTEGVRFILEKWELLHTAVVEEWGGHGSKSKFDHIVEDLVLNCEDQWREGNDLHLDTLDVYLIECLESDFNVDFEDDSVVTQCSQLIAELYHKCATGAVDEGRALLHRVAESAAAKARSSSSRRQRTNDDDDDDDDDGDSDDGSGDDDEEEGGEEGQAAGAGAGDGSSGRGPRRVIDDDGWETIVPKGSKGKQGAAAAAPSSSSAAAAASSSSSNSSSYASSGAAAPQSEDKNKMEEEQG